MPSNIYSKSKGRLLTIHDLQEHKPPPVVPIIHKGVLNIGSKCIIFGDEGTFKSAIVAHAAYCLARGSNWLGFATSKANILYVQAEMSLSQTKERLEQYCSGSMDIYQARVGKVPDEEAKTMAYAYPDNVVTESVIQDVSLDTENGYQFIRSEIELMITEMPSLPIVLIADPLFKMFRYDLIKEDDMRGLTRNIDRLLNDKALFQYHPGMAALIVHHTRKAQVDKEGNVTAGPGSTDMFGSAHLKWWADTLIRTDLDLDDETESTVKVRITKHRLARYPLPKEIWLYWDRGTFHPFIQKIVYPKRPEDSREFRGADLSLLE